MNPPLRVLIVDDEALARARLRTLLGDFDDPPTAVLGEAAHGQEALHLLHGGGFEVVLLDIRMPGLDGLELSRALRLMARPPAVVFVTAHAEHALAAFEVEAVDYLTKPVRAERLRQALLKAQRLVEASRAAAVPDDGQEHLVIQDRGRAERVPLSEVIYLKSELKYLTVRTAVRSHILDGALSDFEERYPRRFVRVHRNALVAREAIRSLERQDDAGEGEGWVLRLHGIAEPVLVSRRQLPAVRDALKER